MSSFFFHLTHMTLCAVGRFFCCHLLYLTTYLSKTFFVDLQNEVGDDTYDGKEEERSHHESPVENKVLDNTNDETKEENDIHFELITRRARGW